MKLYYHWPSTGLKALEGGWFGTFPEHMIITRYKSSERELGVAIVLPEHSQTCPWLPPSLQVGIIGSFHNM